MSGKRTSVENSAVGQAASTLRLIAMSAEDGAFLGSEDDMIRRLEVSRPTLRAASAQVSRENLIHIRRGVGGGYFARLPDSMSVSRIAAQYLQSRATSLQEIIRTIKPIRVEIAAQAAQCRDPELLRALQEFLASEEQRQQSGDSSYADFLRSEREFGKVLGRMSGNGVLTLFLDILYDFSSLLRRDEDVLQGRPERVEAYRDLRARMARAILEGDEEIAIVATRRCSDMISDWMHEDFAGRGFGDVAGAASEG